MTDTRHEAAAWIGREERVDDDLSPTHARAVAAMLDRDSSPFAAGAALLLLWHWFFFPTLARASELGEDGHARRGSFLPPITLPRRMWAGGRIRFPGAARLGRWAERHSRIHSIEDKTGRSGRLTLITVAHDIVQDGVVVTEEEQDLMYAEASRAAPRSTASTEPLTAEWEHRFTTDPVLLFRFSALTFNGHRIHYDWPYTTQVEGYPGLVVHGPLTALALLDAARTRIGREPHAFEYRAMAPLFCGEEVVIGGRTAEDGTEEVWACGPGGRLAMRATVGWKDAVSESFRRRIRRFPH